MDGLAQKPVHCLFVLNTVMNGSIYQITNLTNGKKYIGQTIQEPASRRWNKHCYFARNGSAFPLYNSIRKHGVNAFVFEVIETNIESSDKLNEIEELYITKFDTTNKTFGYNISSKAQGKGKLSEETKEKIRKARTKQVFSKESRKRMSESRMGQKGTFGHAGKKHTTEHKNKMRKLMTGRIFSDESKAKMSKSQIGKTRTEEFKIKISNATTGSKNSMYGKTHSLEARNKIAVAHIGKKWTAEVRKKILDSRKKFYESKKLEKN